MLVLIALRCLVQDFVVGLESSSRSSSSCGTVGWALASSLVYGLEAPYYTHEAARSYCRGVRHDPAPMCAIGWVDMPPLSAERLPCGIDERTCAGVVGDGLLHLEQIETLRY